ncbi:MAG TPA: DUF2764 family protein [Draconibacterium sp.]|nr:DUF2764 family protein [Draconibacterium sp.]
MLNKEYYCLIAGLPDLFFDENKTTVNIPSFRKELKHQINLPDFKLVEYLFFLFDNQNLLNIVFNKDTSNSVPGNLSIKELEFQLSPENEKPELPGYMLRFLNWIKRNDTTELFPEAENKLNTLYYEYALDCPNNFLRQWFGFELNLKNILTASNCLKFNYDLGTHLLKVYENSEVYALLINNKLKASYFEEHIPFHEEIFKIADFELELIEKEKAIDKLKWNYLEENTAFHYFTIEKILAYTIKLLLVKRWSTLDKATGIKLLNKLVDELTESYAFPGEFSITK